MMRIARAQTCDDAAGECDEPDACNEVDTSATESARVGCAQLHAADPRTAKSSAAEVVAPYALGTTIVQAGRRVVVFPLHAEAHAGGDIDCLDERVCANGGCAEAGVLEPGGCDEPAVCESDEQCAGDRGGEGNRCEEPCADDASCGAGNICLDGHCRPAGSCLDNDNCPGNQICDALTGECDEAGACVDNQDCLGTRVCDDGMCMEACADAADCDDGEICQAGLCAVCFGDDDCPGAQTWISLRSIGARQIAAVTLTAQATCLTMPVRRAALQRSTAWSERSA